MELPAIETNVFLILMLAMVASIGGKRDNRPPRYRTLYACEGSLLEIVCEEGTYINLIRANFGRFSISVCNDNGNVEWSVDCMSHRSFRVMQESCGMRRQCTLPASSSIFGDPCRGTLKYLEAHYQCMPSKDAAASVTTPKTVNGNNEVTHHSPLIPPPFHNLNTKVISPIESTVASHPKIIFPQPSNPIVIAPQLDKETQSPMSIPEATSDVSSKNNDNANDNAIPPPQIDSHVDVDIETSRKVPNDVNNEIHFSSSPSPLETKITSDDSIIGDNFLADHCPLNYSRGLYWNWTLAGHVAIVACPGGAKGMARWSCTYVDDRPVWTPPIGPDMSDCASLWLIHLETRIKKGESVVSLTEELAKNCKERILYASDLFRIADIINELIENMDGAIEEFGNDHERRVHVLKELLNAVEDVVSNVLDDYQRDSWRELSFNEQRIVASAMIYALERISFIFAESKTSQSDYIRAHSNIFVSVHVRHISALTNGLTLPPSDATNDMPMVVTTHSNCIYFPYETLLQHASPSGNVRVVFLMYRKLAPLLHPDGDKETDHIPIMRVSNGHTSHVNISRVINSDIIGVMINKERFTPLTESVHLTLKHTHDEKDNDRERLSNSKCVFWDIDRREWSSDGCITVESNATHTVCQCNHLTNFAILMDINDIPLSPPNEFALRVITYFGCIISIVCLLITITTFVSFKNLKSDRSTIHTNLCVCLLMAEMVFLSGVTQTQTKLICGFIAASLHYLFLSAFSWMFFEGFQLYLMLIEVFDQNKSRMKLYYLMAYGIPGMIVIIAASIDPTSYGTERHCWLRTDNFFIWSFVGPVLAILSANLIFLSIAITTMCRHMPNLVNKNKEQTKLTALRVWIRGSLSLVFILGLTWSFGLLYLSQETLPMAYLFTVTNSFQGMFIFVFHCISNEKVRSEYSRLMSRINLTPACIKDNNSNKCERNAVPNEDHLQPVSSTQRSSLYNSPNNSNAKDSSDATNSSANSSGVNVEPLIGHSVTEVSRTRGTPKMRRSAHKYYLTDDASSDYGCKRLEEQNLNHHHRDLYSLRRGYNGHHVIHNPTNFIEHIYECIDEDPYVAKLLLPAINRQINDGQHIRTLSDSSRHSDNHPLIRISSSSAPRNQLNNLPAIVRDNTAMKTTIICGQQQLPQNQMTTMAVLNGSEVICCTLNDHHLCDHPLVSGHSLRENSIVNNIISSHNHHLSSDC